MLTLVSAFEIVTNARRRSHIDGCSDRPGRAIEYVWAADNESAPSARFHVKVGLGHRAVEELTRVATGRSVVASTVGQQFAGRNRRHRRAFVVGPNRRAGSGRCTNDWWESTRIVPVTSHSTTVSRRSSSRAAAPCRRFRSRCVGRERQDEKPSDKPSLPRDLAALSQKIDHVLGVYSEKHLNTGQQSPWEMMHRIVAFGIPTEIRRDAPDGPRVNAIGWLLWGGRANGMPLMVTSGGAPMGRVGPGLQGHPAQFLGMLAQSGVSADSPFQLDGKSVHRRRSHRAREARLQYAHRVDLQVDRPVVLSQQRRNMASRDGQQWSVGRLAKEEIQLPLRNAACGGTHRLFGSEQLVHLPGQARPADRRRVRKSLRSTSAITSATRSTSCKTRMGV